MGRVPVDRASLIQYQARWEDWLAWLAGHLSIYSTAQDLLPGHVWDLGFCEAVGCHLFVARGGAWPSALAGQATKQTQFLHYTNPVVLSVGAAELLPDSPLTLPLEDLIGTDSQKLILRVGQLKQSLIRIVQQRQDLNTILLNESTHRVLHVGIIKALQPAQFKVLKILVEAAGDPLTHDEIASQYAKAIGQAESGLVIHSCVSEINIALSFSGPKRKETYPIEPAADKSYQLKGRYTNRLIFLN